MVERILVISQLNQFISKGITNLLTGQHVAAGLKLCGLGKSTL